MHFPYMKIAIYVLTFATYVYSGYGSSVIGNLRDAIIAAEAVFGDVFKNVISVARKFKTVHEVFDAAVDENCIYKCPGDFTPSKNKFYTPTSNGCGSLGLNIDTKYLPAVEMEKCCDLHDICYDTCNSDKELCDLDFKRCLYKYCETYDKQSTIVDLFSKGCKAASKMLFTGTITLGCKSYLDAQARSCYCPQSQGRNSKDYSNSNDPNSNNNNNNNNYNKKYNKDKKPGYGWKVGGEL